MRPASPKSRMPWEPHSAGAGRGLGIAAKGEKKVMWGVAVQAQLAKAQAKILQLFQTQTA